MIRVLLLAVVIALVAPAAACAQKDKMTLGEALGATVKRKPVTPPKAKTPPCSPCAPTSREPAVKAVPQKGAK